MKWLIHQKLLAATVHGKIPMIATSEVINLTFCNCSLPSWKPLQWCRQLNGDHKDSLMVITKTAWWRSQSLWKFPEATYILLLVHTLDNHHQVHGGNEDPLCGILILPGNHNYTSTPSAAHSFGLSSSSSSVLTSTVEVWVGGFQPITVSLPTPDCIISIGSGLNNPCGQTPTVLGHTS